jgi:hypothetical protein
VIDNMAGIVEVVAGSDELAARARRQVELLAEEPRAGRVYRRDPSSMRTACRSAGACVWRCIQRTHVCMHVAILAVMAHGSSLAVLGWPFSGASFPGSRHSSS